MYVSLGFILFGHTWIAGLGLDGSLITPSRGASVSHPPTPTKPSTGRIPSLARDDTDANTKNAMLALARETTTTVRPSVRPSVFD
jgi:hypothetical protein